jgi:uncharacterized membrane protein
MEAFSDGVIAIILTIMVLELKVPHEASWASLAGEWRYFMNYALSFTVIAIMWVNHHNVIKLAPRSSVSLLWANNHLLFWMSLVPFATSYLGEHPGTPMPVAIYGAVLTMAAMSFVLLRFVINRHHRDNARMREHNRYILRKTLTTAVMYAISVPVAFVTIYASYFVFIIIPLIYFIPDRKDAEFASEME